MPKYEIVTATQAHVTAMLPNVRTADRNEVMASSGLVMELALGKCVERSDLAWTGLIDGEVACIFGVSGASLLSETGYPWMIGTHLIEQHAKPFLRRSRGVIKMMLERYPHLRNYVDVRNSKAIEWLKWLGFEIQAAEPFGMYRMQFHPFELRANHV